ncbi:phosphorylated adapter RNA export protein isoform X2 [Nilaparvata lugens]|uniref:phosphorylated adapter RNA export protein isoform X2 n=1 Tax=Nilaparvata lugens TaxID=108931 RepID=UPI00193E4356|nr:phosphorylated adapter RNA export protein isoform X2 [Nilaparvata lugens]
MESEDGCLEDGEIVDYTPLERPIEMMQKAVEPCRPAALQLSSEEEEESPSSSDSSDSESERRKSRKKRKMTKHYSKFSKNKPMSKYDVWSVGLQEESLAENLNSFNVVKTDQSRSVESYNYKMKYELEDDHHSLHQQLGRNDEEFRTNKRRHGDRGNVHMRLGRRDISPEAKGCSIILFDLAVTSENTDDEVSKDIVEKLSEKKDDLIYRVVTGIGKEKAIELYNETKRIEEDGGMMVMNGSRRRTPGGVYLALLKRDKDIPAEKVKEIFVDDKLCDQQMKKRRTKNWHNRRTQQLKQTLIEDGLLPPSLLTRAELELRNGESSTERGDGVEGEGENAVTNPPPSPATDCDQTEAQVTTTVNSLVTYDDDFLELNADDDMEVF